MDKSEGEKTADSIAHQKTVRRALYIQLSPSAWPRPGLSPLNKLLCALILA